MAAQQCLPLSHHPLPLHHLPTPPPNTTQSGKKAAKPAAKGAKGAKGKVAAKAGPVENPLFPAKPKVLRVGGAPRPGGRDLTRFVKWPRYVRLQRQRAVLYQRLKVPPQVNQFRKPLDKAEAYPLFTLLGKYTPETAAAKKARLEAAAAAKAAGGSGATTRPLAVLKFVLNHITTLVEQKKAKFVAIASDVDPIELVVWLPALCRKMGVPYAIVNTKARLGALVHQKKATAVALTRVNAEDDAALAKLVELSHAKFRDNADLRRKWGGGIMGLKTQARLEKRQKLIAAELAKKAML